MVTGDGNWTSDNDTMEVTRECNSSLKNTTWLDAQMYTGQLVDRSITPLWYLVGITGNSVLIDSALVLKHTCNMQ